MPRLLTRIPFAPEHQRGLADFDCGTEPWAQDATAWIKGEGPGSVLDDLKRGCAVWLYGTPQDGVVGFGSLAASRWRWPNEKDQPSTISIIPMLGIDRRFRGQPHGPDERRFSDQILDHLILEAMRCPDRAPLLGLFVHPDNLAAIRVYERAGFARFYKTWADPGGTRYPSMLLKLAPTDGGAS